MMTSEEASVIVGNISIAPDDCYSVTEYQEAKKMAIKALEKQIPKKLIKEKSIKYDREFYKYENTETKCPCCGTIFLSNSYKYCPNCGQKLDWSEEE